MKEKEKQILREILAIKSECSTSEKEYLQKTQKKCRFLSFIP